jgi:hypothetical protein
MPPAEGTAGYLVSANLLFSLGWPAQPPLDPATGLPRGLPADAGPEQVAYAEALFATWSAHLTPRAEDGDGDVEDWWEAAARLDAALSSGADRILVTGGPERLTRDLTPGLPAAERIPDCDQAAFYGAITEYPQASPHTYVHFGPVSTISGLWQHVGFAADRYGTSQVFTHAAGRRLALVGHDLDKQSGAQRGEQAGCREIVEAMTAWAHEGITDVVIKAVRAKHGIWRLATSVDAEANAKALRSALRWSLVHHEGQPGAYLLQEYVPMRFEYRFFIVDGRPVTGAGCVVEHTPLFADHRPGASSFSPLVRERRAVNLHAGVEDELDNGTWHDTVPYPGPLDHDAPVATPVVSDASLVERYLTLATAFAAQAAGEGVLPRAYTLDVATHRDTGQPLAIECNGLTNSGLYAIKPRLVVRALLSAGDQPALPHALESR